MIAYCSRRNIAARSPFLCGYTRNSKVDFTPQVRKNIRIENPLCGSGFTSRNRAQRFVAHGLAEWAEFGVSIRFLRDPRDHRECSARQHVEATRYWYDRASGTGMAQIGELANTPVSGPSRLLGVGRRKGAGRHTFLATQGL
jgi:hypothetical protein